MLYCPSLSQFIFNVTLFRVKFPPIWISRLPFTVISWSEYDSVSLIIQSPVSGTPEMRIWGVIDGVGVGSGVTFKVVISVTVMSKTTMLEVPLALVALTAT